MIQTDIITDAIPSITTESKQSADDISLLPDEPAKDDLELLAADLLSAMENRDRELFDAIREFFPLKWIKLAAYQLGFKSSNLNKIFDWFK